MLEEKGFTITPLQKIRVVQLLSEKNQLIYSETGLKEFGMYLAPILAKNPDQQTQFYETYKTYLDALKDTEILPPPPLTYKDFLLPILLLIILLVIGYNNWPPNCGFNQDHYHFVCKKSDSDKLMGSDFEVMVGDSLIFENTTIEKHQSDVSFHWQVHDDLTGELEKEERNSLHWGYKVLPIDTNATKWLIMQTENQNGEVISDPDSLRFSISCSDPPKIKMSISDNPKVNEPIQFNAEITEEGNYSYQWQFGDEIRSTDINPQHIFKTNSKFKVELKVTNLAGNAPNCFSTISEIIDLNTDFPNLPIWELEKSNLNRQWVWGWATLLLFAVLFLATINNCYKWFKRPFNEKDTEKEKTEAHVKKIWEVQDHPPYTIPFENKNKVIGIQQEQFNISRGFRQREDSQRLNIDVPGSIKSTLESGGFIKLKFNATSRPSDYLFLIDLQSADSHQAKLFQYLVGIWQSQDVNFDLFYYKTDFGKIWQNNTKKSFTLDQLNRIYSECRIVVFGDAYSMLNTFETKKLQPAYTAALRKWKHRILITPVPVISWTFKEARLYKLFPIFHADLAGLLQASEYVEEGMLEDNLPPTLRKWETKLERNKVDVDTDRDWESLEDHEDYLEKHPAVLEWLLAILVYPTPTWNVTIAIGKGIGAPVTYEHILLLARIPWLQRGEMNIELWEEVFAEKVLSKETEMKTRLAVKKELEAVREDAKVGFANRALETNLIVQNFGINPYKKEHKAAVRSLMGKDSNNSILKEELDYIVERHEGKNKEATQIGDAARIFLKEEKTKLKKPFYTPNFWAAILFSVLFISLGLFVWNTSSDDLYNYIDGMLPEVNEGFVELRDYSFIKEIEPTPSGPWGVNNLAVDIYNNKSIEGFQIPEIFYFNGTGYDSYDSLVETRIIKDFPHDYQKMATIGFWSADELSLGNIVAMSNYYKLLYNAGVEQYNISLGDSTLLESAQFFFKLATSESEIKANEDWEMDFETLFIQSMHGLGLIYFQQGKIDSACYFYKEIITQSEGKFFQDNFNLGEPTLETLTENKCFDPSEFIVSIQRYGNNSKALPFAQDIEKNLQDFGFQTKMVLSDNPKLPTEINYFVDESRVLSTRAAGIVIGIIEREGFLNSLPELTAKRKVRKDSRSDGKYIELRINLSFLDEKIDPVPTITEKNLEIRGRVVDRNGNPIKGVEVRAQKTTSKGDSPFPSRGVGQLYKSIYTDSEGRFLIDTTTKYAGRFMLFFLKGDEYETLGVLLRIQDDIPYQDIILLRKPTVNTLKITIKVEDENGKPIEDAQVNIDNGPFVSKPDLPYGFGGTTRSDGQFEPDHAAEIGDSVRVVVSKENYEKKIIHFLLPKANNNFTITLKENTPLKIVQLFLTNKRNRPALRNKYWYSIKELRGIVIHDTANPSSGANASARRNYFNKTDQYTSMHYVVDDKNIVQCIPEDEVAFHSGGESYKPDGIQIRGKSDLGPNHFLWGIEMCINEDGDFKKTQKNTIKLLQDLMNKNNLSIGDVYRHYDITGKLDPKKLVEEKEWEEFKAKLAVGLNNKSQVRSSFSDEFVPFFPEMIPVEGDIFSMGCTKGEKIPCEKDEFPIREIAIDSFEIGKYEITAGQFAQFLNQYKNTIVKSGEYKGKRLISSRQTLYQFPTSSPFECKVAEELIDQPAANVTWYGAQEYCKWLSTYRNNFTYTLPTEAEWEYAARGGSSSKNYVYSGSNILSDVAHFEADNASYVGSKAFNELRIYDMTGNLYEWCQDCYKNRYNKKLKDGSAVEGQACNRVIRGGGFNDNEAKGYLRVSDRYSADPNEGGTNCGFRVVLRRAFKSKK